ncbi:DNA adenine methylase [Variovorax rhizosphaerae]|uniref:site-specific DNA-methyltransferase (adenine-specific) n=1 Tax=Variovorax rhizosphaerae TaxID=1836200 RepID=A0ABU8WDU2_9BURK
MMHSPLRYPGGKSDFLAVAAEIFQLSGFTGLHVVEPYAGSAAIALGLLDFGLTPSVLLLERDPLLFGFWHSVFCRPEELIARFQELPITLETWHSLQHYLKVSNPMSQDLVALGLAGLFFNRTNFSGILNAGPIGGKQQSSVYDISCRTNKDDIIVRILTLSTLASKVDVQFGDAIALMAKMANRSDCFFYLDPPYFKKGESLYRHFYRLGQHKELANTLSTVEFKWLLSYDDHHVIEFLYEAFNVRRCNFQYSARSYSKRDELLISNFELPNGSKRDLKTARRQRHRTAFFEKSTPHAR